MDCANSMMNCIQYLVTFLHLTPVPTYNYGDWYLVDCIPFMCIHVDVHQLLSLLCMHLHGITCHSEHPVMIYLSR